VKVGKGKRRQQSWEKEEERHGGLKNDGSSETLDAPSDRSSTPGRLVQREEQQPKEKVDGKPEDRRRSGN
jgi:hypothetical protein